MQHNVFLLLHSAVMCILCVEYMMKNKANESLKRLRLILGFGRQISQNRFAEMVGVSLDTIRSVECGRLELSPTLERKIALATGARLHPGGAVYNPNNNPEYKRQWRPFTDGTIRSAYVNAEHPGRDYTFETFRYHCRRFASTPEAARKELDGILPAIESLFMSAARPTSAAAGAPAEMCRNRLPNLAAALWDWISETSSAFGLKDPTPTGEQSPVKPEQIPAVPRSPRRRKASPRTKPRPSSPSKRRRSSS